MEKVVAIYGCVGCFLSICFETFALHTPKAEEGSGSGDNVTSGSSGLTTVQLILVSFGLLTVLIVCSFCTWNWWRRFCRALRGVEDPDPPSAIFDPHNRDPILFPPITTIYSNDAFGGGFDLAVMQVPYIVPIADEVNAYAHDWFETDSKPNFNRANIDYMAEMGRGWFGKVIKAQIKNPSNPFHETGPAIVKVLREDANTRDQMRFLNEARFYRDESHENILKLLGHSIERAPYLLIFESLPLGTLKDFLITKCVETQNYSMFIRMAIDVAMGLEMMERCGFVHGDLAARNCLVANSAGKVKIGDYGLSPQKFREEYYWSSNTAIPIRWVAPECLHITMNTVISQKVTTMSNIWSFGILLWEIIEVGKLPYHDLSDEEVLEQVIVGRTYVLERPKTLRISEAVNDKLYNIMLTCWNSEPSSRPRITAVLEVLKTP